MHSKFSEAFGGRASGKLDAAFGESLEIRHVMPGEFVASAPDPQFPPFTVTGIIDTPQQIVAPAGTADGAKSEMQIGGHVVDFALSQFSARCPKPAQGTIVIAINRPGKPRFRVRDNPNDGHGRIECHLDELSVGRRI
jgi:hypothetical protein